MLRELAIRVQRLRGSRAVIGVALLVAGLTGSDGTGAAAAEKAFKPSRILAGLADNTALDLGRYECESRVPGLRCRSIFAYSRINYDPYSHRILVFGGGHAATGRTDVDVFDLSSLRWQSLYPSMSCDEVAKGDIDPRGFHRSTGHPVARHTYDQNVIGTVNGRARLMMFSTEGLPGACHQYRASIRSVATLPLDEPSPRWEYSPEFALPWGFAGPAEFDPVSGMVILFGRRPSAMWVYDPAAHKVVASVRDLARPTNSSNLLYYPPNDRMYLIDRETMQISEIALNRTDWSATTATLVPIEGAAPPPMRNFAYDSRNQVIGGIVGGTFHAFVPATRTWHAEKMAAISGDNAAVGTVVHHAIDYDPVNNVFVFVTDRASGDRTWVYRYRR